MNNFQNEYAISCNAIASILDEQSKLNDHTTSTEVKLKASLKSLVHILNQKDTLKANEQRTIREIIQFHVDQIKTKDQVDYQGLRQYQTELKRIFHQSHAKGDSKLTIRLPDIHSQTTTDVAGPSSSTSSSTMLLSAQSSLNVVLRTLEDAIPMYKELSELLDEAGKRNNSRRARNALVKSSSQMAQSCATTVSTVGFHVTKLRDELNTLNNIDTGKMCLPDKSVRNLAKLLHEQMDQDSPLYSQVQTLASDPAQSLKVNSKLDMLLAHNKLTPAGNLNNNKIRRKLYSVSSTDKRSTKRKRHTRSQSPSKPVAKKERRISPLKQSRLKTSMKKGSKPTTPSKQAKGSLTRRQKGMILPSLKAAKNN